MFPLPLRLSNRRPLIPVTVHYVKGFIERSPLIHKQIHRKPSFHKLEIRREEGEGKQISRASKWSIQESALDQERWENVQVSSHYQRYVIEISFLSFFFALVISNAYTNFFFFFILPASRWFTNSRDLEYLDVRWKIGSIHESSPCRGGESIKLMASS